MFGLRRIQSKFVMDGAGGEGANNGGGGGSAGGAGGAGQGAGASGAGGGSGVLSGGGAGSAGNGSGAGAGNGQAGAQGGAAGAEIKFPENWKLGLPQELQESGALSVIHDIPSLAKSYVAAQKAIGADKIVLPSKHATADEWREVYHKLGLPKEAKDYKLEAPKDTTIDGKFVTDLSAKAHELGILPAQAQNLVNWFGELNKNATADLVKSQEAQVKEELGKLQTEWGAAYDKKVGEAVQALAHFATKDEIVALDKAGLTNNTTLIRIFAKAADVLKEDGIIREDGSGSGVMTPAAAKEAYNAILANMSHPYYQKDHPNHKAAVEEVSKLMKMSNPRK
jgi:hypothetical protein